MNLLKYANDKINGAISLLESASADVEDIHHSAVMSVVTQLEIIQEAINLKGPVSAASEALQIDALVMLGEGAATLRAREVLDDYVSVRLISSEAAILSVQSRYLDADDTPLRMIGESLFEARHWIGCARQAVNTELDYQSQLKAVA